NVTRETQYRANLESPEAVDEKPWMRSMIDPETLARRFHETYERLAPRFGDKTRRKTAVPWDQVPLSNKQLMIAVWDELLHDVLAPQDAENAPTNNDTQERQRRNES